MTSSSLCCSSSTGWIGNGLVSNQFGFDSNVNGSFRLSSQIKKFNQIPPCEYAHCLSWKTCRRRSEVKSQTTRGQEDSGKFRNEPSDGQQIRKWAELQEHHLLLERRPIVSRWRHRPLQVVGAGDRSNRGGERRVRPDSSEVSEVVQA